jgi:hypothetical protein
MTVYTVSGSITIPTAVATATIIAKGEGGSGAPVSGSSYGSGSSGGNTTFIGVIANGGGGGVSATGGGGGASSAPVGYTVVGSSSGNPGQNGGNFSSNVAAAAGGAGNEGGDGSAGGTSSFNTTTGGNFAFTTGGCGFYPSCGSFTVCGTSFCCPNCAGPGSGVLFQTNRCCYPTVTTTTYTRGGGGGEGGFIHVTLDQATISPFAGQTQGFTVNAGGSNLDNGSLEVLFTLKPQNPVWLRLSTGWTLMSGVSVNTASDGWTEVNPTQTT